MWQLKVGSRFERFKAPENTLKIYILFRPFKRFLSLLEHWYSIHSNQTKYFNKLHKYLSKNHKNLLTTNNILKQNTSFNFFSFLCSYSRYRSANYYRASNICELSEMDRITLAGTSAFQSHDGIDYIENNCAEEPNKLCEFKRLSGRILKTVDSVYQDVGSIDECRDLCINSPYR